MLLFFLCIHLQAFAAPSIVGGTVLSGINADDDLTMDIEVSEASVHIYLYHDYDKDGVIDNSEWPVIDEIVIDNDTDASGLLTWDTNPSVGSISLAVDPFGAGSGFLPVGDFILRVENSIAEEATAQFSINPSLSSQTITGRVSVDGTGMPVSDALVACVSSSGGCGSFTDGNGDYTLQVPVTGDYDIRVNKKGYAEKTVNLTVTGAGVTDHNISLTPVITGTIKESGTGNLVDGAEVWARAADGSYSQTYTDSNGDYSLPVTGGKEWFMGAKGTSQLFGPQVPLHNYDSNLFITPLTSLGDSGSGRYGVDFSEVPPDTGPVEEIAYIGLGQSMPDMSNTGFTIETKIKKKTSGSLNGGLFSRAVDQRGILLYVNNSIPMFAMKKEGLDAYKVDSGYPLQSDSWTHVAGVLTNVDHMGHIMIANNTATTVLGAIHPLLWIQTASLISATMIQAARSFFMLQTHQAHGSQRLWILQEMSGSTQQSA